jgi:hypothetical protein
MRKNVDSPFFMTFQKFLKDPEALYKVEMTEAPEKVPEPFPGQYQTEKPPETTNNHNNPGQHTPVIGPDHYPTYNMKKFKFRFFKIEY